MQPWMGVLALEPLDGAPLAGRQLEPEVAERLGELLALQLGRFLPTAHEYALAWAAAAYDPAQLLRRGLPLHAELTNLFQAGQRAGLAAGQILTLSAREGRMPTAVLEPDAALGDGRLYVVPVVVLGDESAIEAASQRLETVLMDEGLADPRIVGELSQAFGVRFEHARWLSLTDLAAMMAAQLTHVGMAPAWALLEELLYAEEPESMAVDTALGQWITLEGEAVRIAVEPYAAFAARHAGESSETDEELVQAWLARIHEQRQYAALLGAHGITLDFAAETPAQIVDGCLVDRRAEGEPAAALVHAHRSLGPVAITLADARGQVLEHCQPLSPAALVARLDALGRAGVAITRENIVSVLADGSDLAGPGPCLVQ
jgi:hypothetical protein